METIAMINLRLAKEYMAGPIFCFDPESMGHVDLVDLPISDELRLAISTWDDEYQGTFNDEYPPDSGFDSPEVDQDHIERGAILAERLQSELGSEYKVEYQA
ncbi:MAG: hypothetical protein ABW116_04115 [Candidatus Sedimenticola sp. 20ELBAFRAG]